MSGLSKERSVRRARRLSFCMGAATLFAGTMAFAAPANLGNGLGVLADSWSATQGLSGSALSAAAPYNGFTTQQAASYDQLAIKDDKGPQQTTRYLVRINGDGKMPIGVLAQNLASISSFQLKSADPKYRSVGVMDAYIALSDVKALSSATGVRSVILELQPRHGRVVKTLESVGTPPPHPAASDGDQFALLGTVFDEGVTQHRVDQINRFYNPAAAHDYEGAGMKIGFLSNSFAAQAAAAATDVTNHDLPGAVDNPLNTTPVLVLEDVADPSSDDEGRAMVQIGYKMAPKAQLAFATANLGEVDFANNIRALAGIQSAPNANPNFAADTICDDVSYYDEPYFQDGIIADGVDDAAAVGVAYFSSAANDVGVNGYESELRWVPNGTGLTAAAGNTALAGTNINLANVPTELYAGGFHNFNPNVGQQDIAQTVNIQSNANEPPTVLEWNEPYDQTSEPNFVEPPVFTASSTMTAAGTTVTLPVPTNLTANTLYQVDCDAANGSDFDCILTVNGPGGAVIDHQDTTVDETARFFAPTTGAYSISINRYGSTSGDFTVTLHATTGFSGPAVQTRISLLAFTSAGVYVPSSSLTANPLATNEPIQLGATLRSGGSQLQYVIARGNVPTGPNVATRVRYLIPGNGLGGIGPNEYFSYNTVTTGGHAMAQGSNGTAAYDVQRPNMPEAFTSPGPVRIYFDKSGSGTQFILPQIRKQPRIAAADGASNTTLAPNFYGTSAAGPHAAAIAALVLEAHGGAHSVTPTQMTNLLEHSTFLHDLDPNYASGIATTANGDRIAIRISSDQSANGTFGTGTGGADGNAIVVTYTGASSLKTLVFNPQGTGATGGDVSGGSVDITPVSGAATPTVQYSVTSAPGMIFAPGASNTRPFKVGVQSTVPSASVTAAFTNVSSMCSSCWWTMGLTFADNAFTADKNLRFTVGRGDFGSGLLNYSGDLFGGGVVIPTREVIQSGMTFSGTTADGQTFNGVIMNRLGAGYTPLDGYGFIDAEKAVSQSIE